MTELATLLVPSRLLDRLEGSLVVSEDWFAAVSGQLADESDA